MPTLAPPAQAATGKGSLHLPPLLACRLVRPLTCLPACLVANLSVLRPSVHPLAACRAPEVLKCHPVDTAEPKADMFSLAVLMDDIRQV